MIVLLSLYSVLNFIAILVGYSVEHDRRVYGYDHDITLLHLFFPAFFIGKYGHRLLSGWTVIIDILTYDLRKLWRK